MRFLGRSLSGSDIDGCAGLPHNARHQAMPVFSTSSDSVPNLGGGSREIGPFFRAI